MRIGVTTFGGDSGKSGISQYMSHLLQRFPAIAPDIEFEVILYKDETDMFLEGVTGAGVCHACELFRPPTLNLLWHQIGLPLLCVRRGYDLLFIPPASVLDAVPHRGERHGLVGAAYRRKIRSASLVLQPARSPNAHSPVDGHPDA